MKYFTFILIAFAVAIQLTSGASVAATKNQAPAPSFDSPPIGTLLRSVIIYVVRDIVSKFIPIFVQFAPANIQLSVPKVIYTLQRVQEPNAATVVAALLQLVGVDLTKIPALQTLSTPISRVQIDIYDFINKLKRSIPSGAQTVTFPILVTFVGYYFAELSTEVYVNQLNYLSSGQ